MGAKDTKFRQGCRRSAVCVNGSESAACGAQRVILDVMSIRPTALRGRWRSSFTEESASSSEAEQTYRYVRLAVIALMVAIGIAVICQSVRQKSLLASVSAYYYTPAQSIFVGGLIGLGVAMVALKGTTDFEDIALNIGGMLCPIIAVVPTSRTDLDSNLHGVVKACRVARASFTVGTSPSRLDCGTADSLAAAARANVQNNMFTLLAAGGLALAVVTIVSLVDSHRSTRGRENRNALAVWGFLLAWLVYLLALVTFWVTPDWFIARAHYCSAAGLFTCALAAVLANGIRKTHAAKSADPLQKPATRQGRWYFYLAIAMFVAAVVLVLLVVTGHVTLFWLEAVLSAFFGVFWVGQTKDRWNAAEQLND